MKARQKVSPVDLGQGVVLGAGLFLFWFGIRFQDIVGLMSGVALTMLGMLYFVDRYQTIRVVVDEDEKD